MTILGIDPGTLTLGYGLIETGNGSTTILDCDIVVNHRTTKMPDRLHTIFLAVNKIIDQYHPDVLSLETAFHKKNVQAALKLGLARGVIMLAAVTMEIPIYEYSPREIKQALVGNGNASKQQVQYMIKSLLKMKKTPIGFDTTDALAVAMCHLHRSQSPKQQFTGWKSFLVAHPDRISKTTPRGK